MDNILANILAFTEGGKSSNVSFLSVKPDVTTKFAKAGNITVKTSDTVLGLICFSKERPFQLHQFLLSLAGSFDQPPDKIMVIYKPGEFEDLYSKVFDIHSSVIAVKETEFQTDLLDCVNLLPSESFVVFCVDDLLFVNNMLIREYISCLSDDPQIFSLQLKLHPGIIYSHSGTRASPPPRLTGARTHGDPSLVYLTYPLSRDSDSSSEWRYPFDLCASVYRLAEVKEVLGMAAAHSIDALSNPNKLEVSGNRVFWSSGMWGRFSRCACPARPLLSVVTINRVQATYDVPIYRNSNSDLHTLNNLLRHSVVGEGEGDDEMVRFDLPRYRSLNSLSVHIGEVYFAFTQKSAVPRNLSIIQVSVLLPVFNGERYLRQCLDSLFRQPQGCHFEVLLVDDGSSDGSLAIAEEYRAEADGAGNPLVVLTLPHRGLAEALDAGINRASADIIARMDADDICEPHRLARQFIHLRAHPEVHVLGAQALTFSGPAPCSIDSDASSHLAANMPTHPVLVAWEMLFRCALLHPTVMFRRQIVLQCGGYANASCAGDGIDMPYQSVPDVGLVEDYSLWARVLDRHPLGIASLPDVLLHLRLRPDSKSQVEAARAREASRGLQFARLTALVSSSAKGEKEVLEPLLREGFDALMDAERHLTSAEGAADALRALEVMFDSFSRHLSLWGSAGSAADLDMLTLRCQETGLLSQMAAVGVADHDNDVGTENEPSDVQCMLRHSVEKLRRRFIVAANRRFPFNDSLKLLISLRGDKCLNDSTNAQSVMLLKDFIVGGNR